MFFRFRILERNRRSGKVEVGSWNLGMFLWRIARAPVNLIELSMFNIIKLNVTILLNNNPCSWTRYVIFN